MDIGFIPEPDAVASKFKATGCPALSQKNGALPPPVGVRGKPFLDRQNELEISDIELEEDEEEEDEDEEEQYDDALEKAALLEEPPPRRRPSCLDSNRSEASPPLLGDEVSTIRISLLSCLLACVQNSSKASEKKAPQSNRRERRKKKERKEKAREKRE